jgi:G:T-mismatch repair DNA endonuclease (very short patch repair protein)
MPARVEASLARTMVAIGSRSRADARPAPGEPSFILAALAIVSRM